MSAGAEQKGDCCKENPENKEDAEKENEIPALRETIARLQARVRQLEDKLRDATTADWLIVEGSVPLQQERCEHETRDANGDILTTEDADLIERQRSTIRELRSEIEGLKGKADGYPILELFTGRRYSDMEAQLVVVTEKLEHFRAADLEHTREIATLTSKLEATQTEAEQQLRQLEAQLKKRGLSQPCNAAADEGLISDDGGVDCRNQRSHNENGSAESSKLLNEVEALKEDKKRLQQEMVSLKQEIRRRSHRYSSKAVVKEGRNDLKQSQLQIDRLENQVQDLRKKLDIERSQSQVFSEDFEKERDDRITAIAKLNETEKDLKSVKIKLEQTEAELERHKTILADTETIAARNNKQLITDLEAAREEIAVKVAQVKQYQRQVEMHKLQVDKDCSKPESQQKAEPTPPVLDTFATGDESRTKCFIPLASDSTDMAMPVNVRASNMDDKGTQTSIEDCALCDHSEQIGLFRMSEDDVSNLPPPIFHTEVFSRQILIDRHMFASTNDGRDLPPPIHMPREGPITPAGRFEHSVEEDKSTTDDLIYNLDKEMQYEADQVRASEKCKDRPTQHEVPLDFNLKCLVCSKVFRKGQIQRYREHVSNCKGCR